MCTLAFFQFGDCLDVWIGLDLSPSIPRMGVKIKLLHWESLFLTLPSFWSLIRPTSGSFMLHLGETLFDISPSPRVLDKTGQSHSLLLQVTELYNMSLGSPITGGPNRLSGASCAD